MAGLKAWRLSRKRYAEAAFTGEGARLLGGRWNPPGSPMVYTSLSLSLAVLEVLVHLQVATAPDDWVSVAVDLRIDHSQVERVGIEQLPHNWRRVDHPALQMLAEAWVKSGKSLVLLVPSVVVEGE